VHRAAEAEAIEMGQAQRPGAQARAVAAPFGAGLRDMAKRIGARVAIGGRIFCAAATDRIEHDDDCTAHRTFPSDAPDATVRSEAWPARRNCQWRADRRDDHGFEP
jgi:hypothetical protein